MPRQTASKEYIFPDGFQLAVDIGDGFEDVGLVAGGNWHLRIEMR